jgi:ABC-type nitrate/sulfonate/bicarbonate transport system permease component
MGDDPAMNAIHHYINDNLSDMIRQILQFLAPFALILVAWELIGRLGAIDPTIIPLPSTILRKFWELAIQSDVLLQHMLSSFYRLVLGYILAVGLGVVGGALLALNRLIREMFEPVLTLLISVPTIAWVPVLLITMGLGDKTVITAIFLGGFFAITYNTMRGIEMVDPSLVNAARTIGLGNIKLFLTVLLPGALSSILTGMRLGIGYAWRALVGGEMLSAMTQWGIGKMIYQARYWNDVAAMFMGLVIIGVTGLLLDQTLLNGLEQRTVERWGMLTKR